MIRSHNIKYRTVTTLAIFTIMIFIFGTAHSDVIHIDPNGNDNTGNGASANPYWSLQRAEKHPVHPGDTILVHAGTYTDDPDDVWVLEDLVGVPNQWITIMGEQGGSKPVFDRIGLLICAAYGQGEDTLSYFRIKDIVFRNSWMHCINITHDPFRDLPCHHIEFSGIEMYNSGYAGFKMGGIDNFRITNCLYTEPAGINYPGIAVDMVGCHDGIIEDCTFTNLGYQCQNNPDWYSSCFMIKGGSRDVIVRDNLVESVYQACLAGQTTGVDFFTPPLGSQDADGDIVNYEAKRIKFYTNIIVNATKPMVFSNSRECEFCNNIVYSPIDNDSGLDYHFSYFVQVRAFSESMYGVTMVKDRNGIVKNNIAVFGRPYGWDPDDFIFWCQTTYNEFSTFVIENNLLYCIWDPSISEPDWNNIFNKDGMPTINNNIYGQDPLWVDPSAYNFWFSDPSSPAIGNGQYLSAIIEDFYDNAYQVLNPTIGAIEYNTEHSAPGAPTTIRIWPR